MSSEDIELNECREIVLNEFELLKESIELYKKIEIDYIKLLLWAFNCLKEAQTSIIRFDDPYFVDNEIKRLELKLYLKV